MLSCRVPEIVGEKAYAGYALLPNDDGNVADGSFSSVLLQERQFVRHFVRIADIVTDQVAQVYQRFQVFMHEFDADLLLSGMGDFGLEVELDIGIGQRNVDLTMVADIQGQVLIESEQGAFQRDIQDFAMDSLTIDLDFGVGNELDSGETSFLHVFYPRPKFGLSIVQLLKLPATSRFVQFDGSSSCF